jgi:pimeloyl-ACP methyl ester carboxylesterase/DNA-binding CsgD family transcriptional regulator
VRQAVSFLADRKGRSVAYAKVGRGRPLICCETGFVTNLDVLWSNPANRRFIEALAAAHTVIRFDQPGVGLGDHVAATEGFSERVEVLEDVIDRLALEQVDIFATSQAGPAAITYAARHPERVGRLALFGTFAEGPALGNARVQAALIELCLVEWGLASGTLADVWCPDDLAGRQFWAKLMHSSITAQRAATMFAEAFSTDVSDLLPLVHAPTLVLHRRRDRCVGFEHGLALAAGIAGARFVSLEGGDHLLYAGDVDSIIEPTVEFLSPDEPRSTTDQLTARELEVATLVADGLTNSEIAARLHISRRTTDAHLEHMRDKLGFRSRAQIAAWSTSLTHRR